MIYPSPDAVEAMLHGIPETPGGAVAGEGTAAPGSTPRTWTIEMPAGMEMLNSNDRDGHWARRKRATADLRKSAAWLARKQRIPPLAFAHILAVYQPPNRRRRDPANLYPSVKACVDGICQDAKVLPDDDATHLEGPDMRLGEVFPRGRLVLTITELCPEGCDEYGWLLTDPRECTCGAGPSGYNGQHERGCGFLPCPAGCWQRDPAAGDAP